MFFIHDVEFAEEALVELVVADNEEGVVDVLFDNVGVYNETRGRRVEDNVVVALAQVVQELSEAIVAQQFGGVGGYGASEDAVHIVGHQIMLDDALPIVGSASQESGEACVLARIELAGERGFAQVEVDDDDAFACHAKAGGQVGGHKGLTHAGEDRGDHQYPAGSVAAVAQEVDFGTQQAEGL